MTSRAFTILLLPGGWHTPSHYTSFVEHASKLGVRANVVALPSTSGHYTNRDFDLDVRQATKDLRLLLDEDKDVLLLAHSYGGLLACEAVEVESNVASGRILGIMFVSAWVPQKGLTFGELIPGDGRDWIENCEAYCLAMNASETFYNQVPEPARTRLANSVVPWSVSVYSTPTRGQSWTRHGCYYIRCGKDKALTPEEQDENIGRVPNVRVLHLPESDHFPFESCTAELLQMAMAVGLSNPINES